MIHNSLAGHSCKSAVSVVNCEGLARTRTTSSGKWRGTKQRNPFPMSSRDPFAFVKIASFSMPIVGALYQTARTKLHFAKNSSEDTDTTISGNCGTDYLPKSLSQRTLQMWCCHRSSLHWRPTHCSQQGRPRCVIKAKTSQLVTTVDQRLWTYICCRSSKSLCRRPYGAEL